RLDDRPVLHGPQRRCLLRRCRHRPAEPDLRRRLALRPGRVGVPRRARRTAVADAGPPSAGRPRFPRGRPPLPAPGARPSAPPSRSRHSHDPDPSAPAPGPPPPEAAPPGAVPAPRMSRDATAWALAGYFGLQSGAAYIVMGWLPQIFRDAGLSAETAGLLFS